MPDEITGLSVLQPTWLPGVWRLWYLAKRDNGNTYQDWIFIRDETDNHLPDKMPKWAEGTYSIWKFRREGNRLHGYPSINDVSSKWHNSYNWSVEFVEMVKPCSPTGEDWDDTSERWIRGSTVHYDLNLEGGREWLPEMREKGIIK